MPGAKFLGNCDPVALADFNPSEASITFPYQGSARTMSWMDFTQHLFATYESRQHEISQQKAIAELVLSLAQVRDAVASLESTATTQEALDLVSASIASLRSDQADRLNAINNNLTALQSSLAQSQAQLAQSQTSLQALNAAVSTLNTDEVLDDQAVAALQQHFSELQIALNGLKTSSATNEAVTTLQTQLSTLASGEKADTQSILSSIATINQNIASLQSTQASDRTSAASSLSKLQSAIDSLNTDEVLDDQTVANLQSSLSTLQSTLSGLQTSAATKDAVNTLQTQLNALAAGEKADTQALSSSLSTLSQSIASLQSSQSAEQVRVNNLITEIKTSVTSLQGQETLDANAISTLQGNYTTLNNSLSNLQLTAATTSVTNQLKADFTALQTKEAADISSVNATILQIQSSIGSINLSDQNQTTLINSLQSAQTSASQVQAAKDAQQDTLIQQLLNVEVYKKNKTIKVPEDFSTIQAAINSLKNYACIGCVIDVKPGTYDEFLFLNDIFTKGKPNFSATTEDLPGVLGSHGLELRVRNYTDGMVPGVTIRGLASYIQDLGVYGFNANMNSLTADYPYGFAALLNANLFAYDCRVNNASGNNVSSNYGEGFSARNNSLLKARKATVTGCNIGFYAYRNSRLSAPTASALNSKFWGFYSVESSSVYVPYSTANNGVHGFGAYYGSYLVCNYCTQIGTNGGAGFHAYNAAMYAAYSTADYNVYGFWSNTQATIAASYGVSKRASTYAFAADVGSSLYADNATAQNSSVGYVSQNGSQVFAQSTAAKNSGNTVNYSPGTSGTVGNNNAFITFS